MLDEMLERLSGKTEAELVEVNAMVDKEMGPLKWIPNPGPQTDAYWSEADVLLYGGAGGGGKGFIKGTLIVTPFGLRPIENLAVGDTIMAADGTPTKVIGIFPQPKQLIFKVSFQDGAYVLCDAPHLWNYSVSGKVWSKSGRKWKVGTTEQLISMIESGRKILIPTCSPLKFTKSYKYNMRVIDPYVLGLLLGDGYTAQSGPGAKWSFSTNDKELLEALPGDWIGDGRCNYRVRGEWRKILIHEFSRLGLNGRKSHDKFVPQSYAWGSVADRIAILQGLMDTDGTITPDGKAYFTSTSEQLCSDVRWLVTSLGGRATITSRIPTCSNGANGPTKGHRAWTAYIRMPDNSILFRLKRKTDRALGPKEVKRKIVSIEPRDKEETVCIAVDHPESLYVVGEDMVVTHNSDLGLGLAVTAHQRSLVMRRKYTDLAYLTDRTIEIQGSRKGFNGSAPPRFDLGDKKLVEYGAAQSVGDELSWMGRPHDLLYIDEAAHFAESQIRALMGWVRTVVPGQRVRVVLGSNPPLSDEGVWMFKMFGPWLDPEFPNPAKPGELRWCIVDDDDKDIWVDGPGMHDMTGNFVSDDTKVEIEGVSSSMSRTFIPAKLKDNPFQNTPEYRAQQDGLPKYMRDAIRDGNFLAVRKDHALQVIPTSWIKASMDRWKPNPPKDIPMCAIAADLTGTSTGDGKKQDKFVLASRHDGYYNPLIVNKASDSPHGKDKAAVILKNRRDMAQIILDMGGGYGDSTYEHLFNAHGIRATKYKGAEKSTARTKKSKIPFYNKRAASYYGFMEDLDPGQPGGSKITLPPLNFLLADLCSIRFDKNHSDAKVIKLEPKVQLCARLGRSTDYSDPVIEAWVGGGKMASYHKQWSKKGRTPQVIRRR
jgi:hypothetical protein